RHFPSHASSRSRMRVLIEIGHPAHVHFFVRTIRRLEDAGHETVVVTRNKEMVNELLERYGIPFRCLSSPAKGRFGLAAELLVRWAKITWLLCTEPVDLVVSISGISTSPPAWLMGKPNLTFTDTEDARLSNAIAFPFSDRVLTPDFFLEDLGDKHVRYR